MCSSLLPIVYIFIVLVIAFVTIGFYKVPKFDVLLILLSVVVLIVTMVLGHFVKGKVKEHFTDENTPQNLKPIELEEDITPIQSHLVDYLTAFNKSSYDIDGNIWTNIAAKQKDGKTCDTSASNSAFTFEMPPVFNRKSGFYMGNNRLIGPLSNALKIQFHNTFTLVLACKHGNLLVDQTNNEIEILKMYANSPNNNGLSLYIQRGSLKNINNVQMGNLMFQYADREPLQCKLQPDHDMIPFEKDIYTLYFIIKETDHVRILTMTEKNNSVDEILRFNVENTDVNFSNKAVVFNRLKNWNASLYNLGIYDVALSDDDITKFYSHLMMEYMKYINQSYIDMIKQYNDTLTMLSKSLQCPFDTNVCKACSEVTKWSDMSQLLTSSTTCRKAVNEFCMANPTHSLCACWDSKTTNFNSSSCKSFRGIFAGRNLCLEGLSQADIDHIMSKYGLIKPESCPKPLPDASLLKNKYPDYEFEKMRIKLDESSAKVRPVYPEPKEGDEEYSWQKLKVKYNQDVKADPSAKDMTTKDFAVGNFYKKDPETNYKITSKKVASDYTKFQEQVKKEQEKLNDTQDLNIIPEKSYDDSKVDVEEKDSFFTRFMKVVFQA